MCNAPAFHLIHVMNSSDGQTSLLVYIINNLLHVATSPKHAVMFEKPYLTENRWMHIGITHSPAKRTFTGPGVGQISLFVNGIMVDTQKLGYPASSSKDAYAYIGTAKELRCKSRFMWRIGKLVALAHLCS